MSNSILFSLSHENNGPLSKCKRFIDSHGRLKLLYTKGPIDRMLGLGLGPGGGGGGGYSRIMVNGGPRL